MRLLISNAHVFPGSRKHAFGIFRKQIIPLSLSQVTIRIVIDALLHVLDRSHPFVKRGRCRRSGTWQLAEAALRDGAAFA